MYKTSYENSVKAKDSTYSSCFLGELKEKISREKNKNMRHNIVIMNEDGGQCTNNTVGYSDTKSLSAPLSYCITDIFRCFVQVHMQKKLNYVLILSPKNSSVLD